MGLIRTLHFIMAHPLNRHNKIHALWRFISWQIGSRLVNSYPVIVDFGEKSKLFLKRGLTGASGNYYCGLHEFEDMSFVLHALRNTDCFVDVGANIGSYSILAASEVGANTISIEPIEKTFNWLKLNLSINQLESKAKSLNIGLGSKKGNVRFTVSLDTVNHVAVNGEIDTIVVPVDTFDNVCTLTNSTFVKIDVEGYETEVLLGMSDALKNENLQVIIMELNGSGELYGYDEDNIHRTLVTSGFQACEYEPLSRTLSRIERRGDQNTIYVRDFDKMRDRVLSSRKFKILGQSI